MIGYFWHVTDLHVDRDYSIRGSRKLSCHRIDKGPSGLRAVGPYGDYLCNTPKLLAVSTFAAMERIKPDVDFILWTGDNMPHTKGITWPALYSQTDWIRAALSRHAQRHRALLLPTLGNHDWVPANALESEDAAHYRAFLSEAGFNQLLLEDGWSTFERGEASRPPGVLTVLELSSASDLNHESPPRLCGVRFVRLRPATATYIMLTSEPPVFDSGYYSRSLSKNIRVVCLNSALWYSVNKGPRPGPTDPQMTWLRDQLHDARRLEQKVFISGHIGPGFLARSIAGETARMVLFDDINDKYQDLIAEYKDVVAGQFFGHQHSNAFVLLSDRNVGLFLADTLTCSKHNFQAYAPHSKPYAGTPVSSVQLAGSVTPWGSGHPVYHAESVPTNPCVRLYTYHRATGALLDYTVYYLDLEKANLDAFYQEEPQWELLYSARNDLGVPDLSTASMVDLAKGIARSPELLSRYIGFSSSLKDAGPCDKACRRTMLCAALASRRDSHAACLAQNDRHRRARLWRTNRDRGVDAIPTCLDVAVLLSVTLTGVAFILLVKRNSTMRLYARYTRIW
ncbi:acid sphingomyelinase-like phosphodiesterase 3b [Dermacentor andersoni]|uniref:acid sphingomyelinase-like phosphodiesterase 3b n=1 Tax=Dermacentor andersoni TaxID=34620 RepID=UPI00241618F7|nr:acid sphingomyelinase-like phosphodiesterase 3b [Dermacentor andersoni]